MQCHTRRSGRKSTHRGRGARGRDAKPRKKRTHFDKRFVNMGSPPPKRPRVADDVAPPPDVTSALDRLAAKLPTRAVRAAPLLTKLLADASLPWSPALAPAVAGCLFALAGGAGDDGARPVGGTPHADLAKAAARAFSAAAALAPTLWPSPSDGDDHGAARRTRAALDGLGAAASLRWRCNTDDSFELARAVKDWKAALADAAAAVRPGGGGDADVAAARGALTAAAAAAQGGSAADAAAAVDWPPAVAAAAMLDGLTAALVYLDTRAVSVPWVPPTLATAVAAAREKAATLPPMLAATFDTLAAAAADRKRGGPPSRPTGDGATSFEAQTARWKGASVSARGSVGARGDGASFQVLGGG